MLEARTKLQISIPDCIKISNISAINHPIFKKLTNHFNYNYKFWHEIASKQFDYIIEKKSFKLKRIANLLSQEIAKLANNNTEFNAMLSFWIQKGLINHDNKKECALVFGYIVTINGKKQNLAEFIQILSLLCATNQFFLNLLQAVFFFLLTAAFARLPNNNLILFFFL